MKWDASGLESMLTRVHSSCVTGNASEASDATATSKQPTYRREASASI
ncbi:MAG: hypothetical protein NTV15_04855 [Candidatus Bathyarchaeota archaeon]|nr:hypothetical protein [Candidatus Bathyarchaeota archaeon]